jgi:hypothetical protein
MSRNANGVNHYLRGVRRLLVESSSFYLLVRLVLLRLISMPFGHQAPHLLESSPTKFEEAGATVFKTATSRHI